MIYSTKDRWIALGKALGSLACAAGFWLVLILACNHGYAAYVMGVFIAALVLFVIWFLYVWFLGGI